MILEAKKLNTMVSVFHIHDIGLLQLSIDFLVPSLLKTSAFFLIYEQHPNNMIFLFIKMPLSFLYGSTNNFKYEKIKNQLLKEDSSLTNFVEVFLCLLKRNSLNALRV